MFVIKNSIKNLIRYKKKYILLIFVIALVSFLSFISIIILNSTNSYLESKKEQYGSIVEISRNFEAMIGGNQQGGSTSTTPVELTDEDYLKYAESEFVSNVIEQTQGDASFDDTIVGIGEDTTTSSTDTTTQSSDTGQMQMRGMSGDNQIYAYNDYSNISLFETSLTMSEGDYPTTENQIMISTQLSEKNSLAVGDSINIVDANSNSVAYTISGLFATADSTDTTNMYSKNDSNKVYMTTDGISLLDNTETSTTPDGSTFERDMFRTEYLYQLTSYKDFDSFNNWLFNEMGLDSTQFELDYPNENLDNVVQPLQSMIESLKIYLLITFVVGGLIILFIVQLNFKDRRYEIGILRALNMKKSTLVTSFIIEIIGATIIAFIVGLIFAIALINPISNVIVSNQTTANNNNAQMGPGGQGGKGGPNVTMGQQSSTSATTSNEITDLDVNVSFVTVIGTLGVIIVFVIVSSLYGLSFVYRYNANKIMKERG